MKRQTKSAIKAEIDRRFGWKEQMFLTHDHPIFGPSGTGVTRSNVFDIVCEELYSGDPQAIKDRIINVFMGLSKERSQGCIDFIKAWRDNSP
jgi:hypothetical protein